MRGYLGESVNDQKHQHLHILNIVHAAFFLLWFANRRYREQEGADTLWANSVQYSLELQCHSRLLPRIHPYLSGHH